MIRAIQSLLDDLLQLVLLKNVIKTSSDIDEPTGRFKSDGVAAQVDSKIVSQRGG